jgi:hypothetical protein
MEVPVRSAVVPSFRLPWWSLEENRRHTDELVMQAGACVVRSRQLIEQSHALIHQVAARLNGAAATAEQEPTARRVARSR